MAEASPILLQVWIVGVACEQFVFAIKVDYDTGNKVQAV
jgi:hypothetical protein